MTRISMICAAAGALAALTSSAHSVSAGSVTIPTPNAPKVHLLPPPPPPTLKLNKANIAVQTIGSQTGGAGSGKAFQVNRTTGSVQFSNGQKGRVPPPGHTVTGGKLPSLLNANSGQGGAGSQGGTGLGGGLSNNNGAAIQPNSFNANSGQGGAGSQGGAGLSGGLSNTGGVLGGNAGQGAGGVGGTGALGGTGQGAGGALFGGTGAPGGTGQGGGGGVGGSRGGGISGGDDAVIKCSAC